MKVALEIDDPRHLYFSLFVPLFIWLFIRCGRRPLRLVWETFRHRKNKKRVGSSVTVPNDVNSSGNSVGSGHSPKLTVEKANSNAHTSKVKLEWITKPSTVVVIKKWKDAFVTDCFKQLIW